MGRGEGRGGEKREGEGKGRGGERPQGSERSLGFKSHMYIKLCVGEGEPRDAASMWSEAAKGDVQHFTICSACTSRV